MTTKNEHKLTKAQAELLAEVRRRPRGHLVSDGYRPAIKLRELGLIETRPAKYGSMVVTPVPTGDEE